MKKYVSVIAIIFAFTAYLQVIGAEENKITGKKKITLGIEGAKGEIIYNQFMEYKVKTFLASFVDKRKSLSTREGFKEVSFIANHSMPAGLNSFMENHSKEYEKELCDDILNVNNDVSLLFTNADIDRLSVKTEKFDNFEVLAIVTVSTINALRPGVDKAGVVERGGKFGHLGTINIIVLTNASLTELAMVRSIITITEAKTIALQDLDIRSSYNPRLQATGTGTDNIIIVSGNGPEIKFISGHTKIGEIIAKAVTSAVKEAALKEKI